MEKLTHLVSLTVGTAGAEDHAATYQDISEVAANFAASHSYVTVSSQLADVDDDSNDDDAEDCTREHVRHDEETLVKVRKALVAALESNQAGVVNGVESIALDCISAMQNAGILFREKR